MGAKIPEVSDANVYKSLSDELISQKRQLFLQGSFVLIYLVYSLYPHILLYCDTLFNNTGYSFYMIPRTYVIC